MKIKLLLLLIIAGSRVLGADFEIKGGVEKRGVYSINPDEGVIALIVRAEGFSIEGCAIVSIQQADSGGTTKTIRRNIWEYIAEFKAEPPLAPGEQVYVPQHNFPP